MQISARQMKRDEVNYGQGGQMFQIETDDITMRIVVCQSLG